MRLVLAGALFLGACLTREEVGREFAPDAGQDAGCVATDAAPGACRREQITEVLMELAQGPWDGEIATGSFTRPVSFEFQLDGRYTASVQCESEEDAACTILFPTEDQGNVRGRYRLDDVLQGEFYGVFDDPAERVTFHSELRRLALQGDRLEFERRGLSVADLTIVAARVMLQRRR